MRRRTLGLVLLVGAVLLWRIAEADRRRVSGSAWRGAAYLVGGYGIYLVVRGWFGQEPLRRPLKVPRHPLQLVSVDTLREESAVLREFGDFEALAAAMALVDEDKPNDAIQRLVAAGASLKQANEMLAEIRRVLG